MAESGGLNLYGYVRNNSINGLDPLGLETILWVRYPAGLVPTGTPIHWGSDVDAGHILLDINGHRLDYTPDTNPASTTDFFKPDQRHDLDRYDRVVLNLTPTQEEIASKRIDELVSANLRWNMNEGRYCSTVVADVLNRTGISAEPINGLSPFTVMNSLAGRGGNGDPRFNPLSLFRP
jgi:uncharacterized protein RhaS with RHS repeats